MKILVTTLLITLLFFSVKGQTVSPLIPQVVPPGPSATALGNYGLVPVDMHTGNTNVSIPLYEFKTKNLSVPISLSYNSSAIHLDEAATWVGMHWSLNAGGIITRIVRDQPDNEVYNSMPYPEHFSTHDVMSFNYVLFNGPNPDALDTEPDLFTYNFMGYTGKLVFDRDGTPITMPRNDLVFEGNPNNDFVNGFIVTTPDGIRYSFKEIERTSISGSGWGTWNVPTAWYLTQIRHPLGDVINLTYEMDYYSYPISTSSIVTKNANNNQDDPCPFADCPPASENDALLIQYVDGKRLRSIESIHNDSIIFNTSTDRSDIDGGSKLCSIDIKDTRGSIIKSFALDYAFSNNTTFIHSLVAIPDQYDQFVIHRMFLTKVIEKDKSGDEVRQYSMEYDDINALPPRLSYARDHWGYFNGADNSGPYPESVTAFYYQGKPVFTGHDANREPDSTHAKKGLLKKITYPTGGSSEFFYEGNTYYAQHQVYPQITPFYMDVSGVQEQYEDIVSSRTIISGVEQDIMLHVTCNYKNGYSSTYGHGKWIVYNQLGSPVGGGDIKVGESKTPYVHLSGGQQYTIAVIAQGPTSDGMWANNTLTALNFQYYATSPQTVTENIETGGIRIASITNYDPVSGNSEITNYHYARHDQLSQSSGIKMGLDPEYTTKYSIKRSCFDPDDPFNLLCTSFSCSYFALHSSGMNSLFRQNGNNIYYEYVTIIRGTNHETGLEEHQFIVTGDTQGTLVWGDDDIPGTPMSNINWDNGLEKAIRFYKKEGSTITLLKEVENEYKKDNRYHKEIPGLSFRTNYWLACGTMEIADYFTCDLTNIQQEGHRCFGLTVGDKIPIPTGIIDMVDAIEYLNISHWFYLSKQIVRTYNENGSNPVVQEIKYFYDNDTHTQLASQVTTTSTGDSLESQYKYAYDYVPVAGDAVELMASPTWNMIGIPIEHIQKINGQVIDASATYFYRYPLIENGNNVDEFIAPKDIYRYETAVPGNGFTESSDGKTFSSYTKKATYKYDNNGNILEVSKEGDVTNNYIWGYGKQFPIAKVENATNASATAQFPFTDYGSAQITEYLGETPVMPSFEISSIQQLSVTLGLVGVGTSPPPSPLVNLTLRSTDGAFVSSITGTWGQHTYLISVGPGTYQWYYSTDDVSFSPPQLTSITFTVSNSYSSSRTGSRIFYTSFEEEGNHTAISYTGEKSYQGQYTVYLPAQNGSYKLTYMKWNTSLQKWELFANDISVSSGTVQPFNIGSAGSIIDEVRLYPSDAVMTTYTYTPMIGMTSQTDPNGTTTYYEYDEFSRLKLVKDDDGNILKSHDYHYKE